jgi:perosamine synthetase
MAVTSKNERYYLQGSTMCSMKAKSIPVAGPSITEKEIAYVTDAVINGWYEGANQYIDKFEKAFAGYLNRKFAISLPSCTSALHLSLCALGIGVGDEVIVPDATWIASAAPISYVGAKPVFADIDARTWCLSAKTIAATLTERTKAIIMVNLYGHMPEWDDVLELAKKYNIPVIEDAAESIGSTYKNRLAGSFGLTSCFSFHGSKTLVTGEGGMLLTDDEEIYNRCMILRDHGRNPGDTLFRNIQIGYKYKMSTLQAALGLAQLERIDELVARKRQIFAWYQDAFRDEERLSLNPDHKDVYNSYWMSTLVFDEALNIHKDDVIKKLHANGVNTRPFFDPLSSLKAYADVPHVRATTAASYNISKRAINLPSALNLEKRDIDVVKDSVMHLLKSRVIA